MQVEPKDSGGNDDLIDMQIDGIYWNGNFI